MGSVKNWGTARTVQAVLQGVEGKIPLENKVTFDLTGDTKEVADVLHRGIGPALQQVEAADAASTSSDAVTAIEGATFARIRKAIGIQEANFFASVALQAGRTESDMKCIPTAQASGKSKAFFFFSPDQRYVFKTCTKKDYKTLVAILPRYLTHVETNRATLLPRYVALFSIPGRPTFVCMTNVFGGQYKVHQRYDLKGSTYGRVASAKELAKKSPVLKDGDFVNRGVRLAFKNAKDADGHERASSGEASALPSEVTTRSSMSEQTAIGGPSSGGWDLPSFLSAIEKDAFFLASVRLIDYSLLVGVHERLPDVQYGRPERTPGLIVLDDGATIMYVCIVDVLTPYGMRKRAETFFMGTCRCANISCQPPLKYARRFVAFATRAAGEASRGEPSASESV